MKIFLAGIMQGSHLALTLHDQQYRPRLAELLQRHWPGCEVYDPLADHADSLNYDESQGRSVFFHHNQMCREVDLLLAFVPQASMGTAIEMWEAHQAGRVVVTISPLTHNWAVKFLSDLLFTDVESFEAALIHGDLVARVRALAAAKASTVPSISAQSTAAFGTGS